MAFNGAGVFNRLYSWVTDAANAVFIDATRMDNEMNGMATGLTNCVTKDGQSTPTANIPMGGFKITGLANGVAATDAAAFGQITAVAAYFDVGNSGVGVTIDFATNGSNQQVTLTNNTTLTLSNGNKAGYCTLKLIQDATGSRTASFTGAGFSATRWIGASTNPTMLGSANTALFVNFYWDGTVWWQQLLGTAARQSIYKVRATRITSNQATTAGVLTKVQFNSAEYDPYGELDTTVNFRFSPKIGGLFLITASLAVQNASTGLLSIQLQVSGSSISGSEHRAVAAATNDTVSVTDVYPISLGSYLEVFFQSTTGAGTIIQANTNTFVTITRLGPAS